MIIESLCLVARRQNRRELHAALSFLLGPTRVEPGCVACHIYQDVTNLSRFHFECVWETEADLIRHLRSEIYKQVLILMELGAEPPSLQFHTVLKTRGMEVVGAARLQEREPLSDDSVFDS